MRVNVHSVVLSHAACRGSPPLLSNTPLRTSKHSRRSSTASRTGGGRSTGAPPPAISSSALPVSSLWQQQRKLDCKVGRAYRGAGAAHGWAG